jgi:hypothetical protein
MECSSPQIWSLLEELAGNGGESGLLYKWHLVPYRYVNINTDLKQRHEINWGLDLHQKSTSFILKNKIRCKITRVPRTDEIVELPVISAWDAIALLCSLNVEIPKKRTAKLLHKHVKQLSKWIVTIQEARLVKRCPAMAEKETGEHIVMAMFGVSVIAPCGGHKNVTATLWSVTDKHLFPRDQGGTLLLELESAQWGNSAETLPWTYLVN